MECTVYKTDENKNGIDLATTFKSFNYYDRTCSFIIRNVGNTSSEVLHQASSDAPFIFNNVYYEDTKLTIKNNYMFIPVGDWNVYHKINKGSNPIRSE